MRTSEHINELATAKAKAVLSFGHIKRDKEVTVKTTTGGSYKFAYAPLESIMAAVRKPLAENGLTITQSVARFDGAQYIVTRLSHASGQWEESYTPIIVVQQGPQAWGSACTYSRRYGTTNLLMLVADDDDDGNAAEGNEVKPAVKASPLDNGETGTAQQKAHAADFAKAFREALDADVEESEKSAQIAQLSDEIREDETVAMLTWGQLNAKERKAIKEYTGKARKAAA